MDNPAQAFPEEAFMWSLPPAQWLRNSPGGGDKVEHFTQKWSETHTGSCIPSFRDQIPGAPAWEKHSHL